MNLKEKTQLDIDIENIEQYADTFLRSIRSAVFSLNEAYTQVWSLPDDRLQKVLQYLHDNNKLQTLLEDHYYAAISLNDIMKRGNIEDSIAYSIKGREFTIINNIVYISSKQEDLFDSDQGEITEFYSDQGEITE